MAGNRRNIVIGVIAGIICSMAFYFLYWVKTPAYSLNIIREAVQKHDVDTFERLVDLDSIFPKVFDDALIAQQEISGENFLDNAFATAIIQGIKPAAIAYFKRETIKLVKGEETPSGTGVPENDKDGLAKGMSKRLLRPANEIRDITTLSKGDGIASVLVKIYDKSVEGDYDVKLKMSQLEDGKWKIKEISNTVEYMLRVDKLYKEKLERLNKSIREEIGKALTCTSAQMAMGSDGNPFFETRWVKYDIEYKNLSQKDIIHFATGNTVINADKKTVRTKVLNWKKLFKAGDSVKLSYRDKLNPFMSSDKALINNIGDKTLKSEPVYIKFVDGTELKLLTELPKP